MFGWGSRLGAPVGLEKNLENLLEIVDTPGAWPYICHVGPRGSREEGSEMSVKTKYTATGSDGKTFTRTSVKTFTHAVIFTAVWTDYSYVSFAGSEELAHKAVSSHYSVPKSAGKYAEQMKAERFANWTHEVVEVTS